MFYSWSADPQGELSSPLEQKGRNRVMGPGHREAVKLEGPTGRPDPCSMVQSVVDGTERGSWYGARYSRWCGVRLVGIATLV